MSFLVYAALAVGLLVVVPIAAHLLRRGRMTETAFPPARLVPTTPATARQRSKLEDRLLLAVRSLMVLALAALGATPLVRCDRLSLTRDAGASVAMALVIDDSESMRAVIDGKSRYDRALEGARDLLRSAREGDAVAIVLAGAPARIALAATTDLSAARATADRLSPSDRATDLSTAIKLARSALAELPHVDKRVIVLSDLASPLDRSAATAIWAPIHELTRKAPNCGIASAHAAKNRVTVRVACTSEAAAEGRSIELAGDARADAGAGGSLGTASFDPRPGAQDVILALDGPSTGIDVRLTGTDAIAHDDLAPVTGQPSRLGIAVVVDPALSSVTTGGPTVLEQALHALEADIIVRPIPLIFDDDSILSRYAAVIVDDPSGFSPEARGALRRFVEHGGVAMALLGPRAETAQLASTLEPFAHGQVRWEGTEASGIEPASVSWLGPEGSSLDDLARRGRARLDAAEMDGARVVGRWHDGVPWLLERRAGSGVVLTVGLPSSVSVSDFALRPGFVALLDHVVSLARSRSGARQTEAGEPWTFPGAEDVLVRGPEDDVEVARLADVSHCAPGEPCESRDVPTVVPTVQGRYVVQVDGERRERVVTIDEAELLAEPQPAGDSAREASAAGTSARVDASRELALAILALFATELVIRLARRLRARRGRADRAAARAL